MKLAQRAKAGADDQNRTGDLVLTKDALCQLSYIGSRIDDCGVLIADSPTNCRFPSRLFPICNPQSEIRNVERETGIEPATNSLEGCDSTTELLPPILLRRWDSGFGTWDLAPSPQIPNPESQIPSSKPNWWRGK